MFPVYRLIFVLILTVLTFYFRPYICNFFRSTDCAFVGLFGRSFGYCILYVLHMCVLWCSMRFLFFFFHIHWMVCRWYNDFRRSSNALFELRQCMRAIQKIYAFIQLITYFQKYSIYIYSCNSADFLILDAPSSSSREFQWRRFKWTVHFEDTQIHLLVLFFLKLLRPSFFSPIFLAGQKYCNLKNVVYFS